MKKNFIYTVTFLLCGALFFSSCEDMLNVESDRVEYEFDDWTLNDSVFSVLGILKSVQEVGDRQVILNEVRADLIDISETKAVVDIQEISKSVFNTETNKYLDVKDYYAIINNCNIYLARVDTTLEKNNVKLMLPEYVAVKSIRAWTYLQLAINYNEIPYFTDPILSHSAAEKVMNQPMLSRNDVISNLIADILPYENPAAYPMPSWDSDGKVLKFGYGENGTEVSTKQLFMPVRMLLGDLYLWKGDYKNAATAYYALLTGAQTNATAPKYGDKTYVSNYTSQEGKSFSAAFGNLFAIKSFSSNADNILTIIPYTSNSIYGTVSELSDIFAPQNDLGGSQVMASQAMLSLSARQVYRYVEGEDIEKPTLVEYSHNYEFPGDLRLASTTYSQISNDEAKVEYKNIIGKFNTEENAFGRNSQHLSQIRTPYIIIARPEHAYLRFAEALVGMERQGYEGAMELAMIVLKEGVKHQYSVLKDPVYEERFKINAKGDTIKKYNIDKVTKDTLGWEYVMEEYLASFTDSIGFNFTDEKFTNNAGIHSRGSGDSERNIYFALDSINVARYFGNTKMEEGKEVITVQPTRDEFLLYMSEIILDEMALELAWEGSRFGDLVRVATALGDPDVLAKRVAGRSYKNTVSHRHPDFEYDAAVYSKMINEANWYLPLPGEAIEPGEVVETPEDFEPAL
ncbi:MAG: RagB/SusD family nutrient uptake outer membrane protein [Bacteroidaceae bacterium]|nr:RagB/SusD family nutrient uptake outer membrane protein [Bacteroidaceae bacterium]